MSSPDARPGKVDFVSDGDALFAGNSRMKPETVRGVFMKLGGKQADQDESSEPVLMPPRALTGFTNLRQLRVDFLPGQKPSGDKPDPGPIAA
jgi:hypothetical protein